MMSALIKKFAKVPDIPEPIEYDAPPLPVPEREKTKFDVVIERERSNYDEARARFARLTDKIDLQVSEMTNGGRLIAVPLCPSACERGPLAERLLDIGLDPFARWNMMYYAPNDQIADQLDTEVYDPDFDNDFDAAMIAFLGKVCASWETFQREEPDASIVQIITYREALQTTVFQQIEEIEKMIYAGLTNYWREFFGEKTSAAP